MRAGLRNSFGWVGTGRCTARRSHLKMVRAIITARKTLLGKLIDIELSMRGILRGFGLKVGAVTRKSFEIRVRELIEGQSTLTAIMEGMLNTRGTLIAEVSVWMRDVLGTSDDLKGLWAGCRDRTADRDCGWRGLGLR